MGDTSTAFRLAPGLLARHRADYHRLVAWLDAEIGRLLDGLDYLGVADRTAIVLTADHGHVLGEGGLIGKCTFAPAAQQVPLLICWPGAGEPSRRRPDLVSGVDLASTFLSLGGVAPPGGLDGYDLAERLEPRSVFSVIGYGERASRACHDGSPFNAHGEWRPGEGWPRRACVRAGRYRLDRNVRLAGGAVDPTDEDPFLVDVVADPTETVNRANDPDLRGVAEQLGQELDAFVAGMAEAPATTVYPAPAPAPTR